MIFFYNLLQFFVYSKKKISFIFLTFAILSVWSIVLSDSIPFTGCFYRFRTVILFAAVQFQIVFVERYTERERPRKSNDIKRENERENQQFIVSYFSFGIIFASSADVCVYVCMCLSR